MGELKNYVVSIHQLEAGTKLYSGSASSEQNLCVQICNILQDTEDFEWDYLNSEEQKEYLRLIKAGQCKEALQYHNTHSDITTDIASIEITTDSFSKVPQTFIFCDVCNQISELPGENICPKCHTDILTVLP